MPISIIEFSVENFKIFKKKTTFSMLTKKSKQSFSKNDYNLLRTSLIYGPNASGKTSILEALGILREVILTSTNVSEDSYLPHFPFMLSDTEDKPTFYEIVFSIKNKIFRYNFSILKNKIFTENLYEISSTGTEKEYLVRKEQDIKLFSDFKESEDIKEKTKEGVLFLSAAFQWNNKLATEIVSGFTNINVISGPESEKYRNYTMNKFKDSSDMKEQILNFLKLADFCIEDGNVEKILLPNAVKERMNTHLIKKIPDEIDTMYFSHNKFDSKDKLIGSKKFNIGDESAGTQKFFNVLGPIVDTLKHGKVLFIDEFDNSLHPFLTKLIIDLFEKNNPENAQLVATTHDTSLLSYKDDFIKSQFWFTEKNKFGAGSLFSLAEFELRNDTEFSKKYLEGRFGALPFIKSL